MHIYSSLSLIWYFGNKWKVSLYPDYHHFLQIQPCQWDWLGKWSQCNRWTRRECCGPSGRHLYFLDHSFVAHQNHRHSISSSLLYRNDHQHAAYIALSSFMSTDLFELFKNTISWHDLWIFGSFSFFFVFWVRHRGPSLSIGSFCIVYIVSVFLISRVTL